MKENSSEIYLKDYLEPSFWIKKTNLSFELDETQTIVESELTIERNQNFSTKTSLVLNGENLVLKEISIDSKILSENEYNYDGKYLSVETVLDKFVLHTIVEINPAENLSCEGLYKSGDIFCTQNEAEGFRKITFYLDRPDVMSVFSTTIIADKDKFPHILSNGNLIATTELENNRHQALWQDPFPKPCYLFALVAGSFGKVSDEYISMSGKNIRLEIYVDKGNEDKTAHAMTSLKKSMKWDEDVYGLEYDLSLYMIVAVDSFNMGAMENKGLNIFNSHYVLAKQETATDKDFKGVEGVIGHEYFHNWTGNRVTCRDWFQLTLKEGLTVYRDQEFSADMGDRSVKRVEDIMALIGHQFPEDAGPLSHPIQPKQYTEINNFYTATVYEKGAEVIRMLATIIGKEQFQKGMKLYFERHDGGAVTTTDFVDAMADAAGVNLEHFKTWYDQNGTPIIKIKTEFDSEQEIYQIHFEQSCQTNNSKYDSVYFPFHFELLDSSGDKIETEESNELIIDKKEFSLKLHGIKETPTPVWNLNFTAPIIVDYHYSLSDLLFIMKNSSDALARFQSVEKIFLMEITRLVEAISDERELLVEASFISGIKTILLDDSIGDEFKAYLINPPSEKALFDKSEKYHFEHFRQARNFLIKTIGLELNDLLMDLVQKLEMKDNFSLAQENIGKRALRVKCMMYLAATNLASAFDVIYNSYTNANNMTEEFGAFQCLLGHENPYQEKAKNSFYEKWKTDTLVIQKWLSAVACSPVTDVEDLLNLESLEVYDKKVPNLIRSVYGAFLQNNIFALNHKEGIFYKLMIDKIIEVDAFNPQLAAGMTKKLNFLYKLESQRASLLQKELKRLQSHKHLSADTLEIVTKNLS